MNKIVNCGCGGEAESALSFDYEYYVMCHKCGTRSDYFLVESEAVQAWNRAMSERTAKVTLLTPDSKGYWSTNGRCQGCGFLLERKHAYCPNCGARLEWE